MTNPRTLGEQWGDERWGPPGIRREQQKPKPKPEFQDWDGFCLTGDPVAPDHVARVSKMVGASQHIGDEHKMMGRLAASHTAPHPPDTAERERAHGYLGPQVDDGA